MSAKGRKPGGVAAAGAGLCAVYDAHGTCGTRAACGMDEAPEVRETCEAHGACGVKEMRTAGEARGVAEARDARDAPKWLRAALEAQNAFSQGETAMAGIARRMQGCRRCALCETRAHVVVGAGNPCADVMFIGEAPGRNEDEQGEPFVGSAGKKLDALLEPAGLSRADVYIANVLKCRPPANRNPRAGEVEACTPWLAGQIAAVHPAAIVPLGNFATRLVLGTREGITALHGGVWHVGKCAVVPMFHPAAAIYDRSKTELVRGDFLKLGELLAHMRAGRIALDGGAGCAKGAGCAGDAKGAVAVKGAGHGAHGAGGMRAVGREEGERIC